MNEEAPPSRLRDLRKIRGLSQGQLADLVDTSTQQISRLEKDQRTLSKEWAQRLAPHLGATWAELMGWDIKQGDDHLRSKDAADVAVQPSAPAPSALMPGGDGVEYLGQAYAPLPVYDVMVSAGPGSFNRDHPIPETYTLLSLDRLKAVTRARVEDLAMIRVSGDSMSPTLMHNDEILVDTSIAKVGRDGMYVVATGEEVQVKRIAWDWATKSMTVASDNPLYPTSRGVHEEDIMILGRVVWISRNVGG